MATICPVMCRDEAAALEECFLKVQAYSDTFFPTEW